MKVFGLQGTILRSPRPADKIVGDSQVRDRLRQLERGDRGDEPGHVVPRTASPGSGEPVRAGAPFPPPPARPKTAMGHASVRGGPAEVSEARSDAFCPG